MQIVTHNEDLAWAAGFFDGEGCTSGGTNVRCPVIIIGQVHREVLEKFLMVLGVGTIYGPYEDHRWEVPKIRYQYHATGFEETQ